MRLFLWCLVLTLLAAPLCAMPTGICSWSCPTPDGRSVFVMCPDTPDEVYGSSKSNGLSIRAKYRKSGLYPIGGTVPYWTVSWYAYPGMVALSPAGDYLAVESPRGLNVGYCLVFFEKNKLVKSWSIHEIDPELARRDRQREDRKTSHIIYCGGHDNWLRLEGAKVSSDGRMELQLSSGTAAFDMHTGELLSRSARVEKDKYPVNPVEYQAFCRVLGTTGTRNPNFVSGLPEFEFDIVQPRPIQRPKVNTLRVPRDTYSFISPPLPTDPTDWHLYIAVGTAFSYALCFCVIRVSKSRSQAAT